MKLNEKIGNLIMVGVNGTSLTQKEKDFISKNNIAGVTLFARNIENPDQVASLIEELQATRMYSANKAPLLIAVDMEGGRVARMKEPFTIWPPVKNLGDIDSATLTYQFAECMGNELMSLGVNVDFAPCVDILTNPKNILIGDRSLGSDINLVGKHASALVRGYLNSGIIACAKHFPGHGNTVIDSHEDLPVDETSLEVLQDREIQAFKKAFRARVDLVMTAHILFKNVDADNPVTFSKKFLQDILPATGYKKLVISDDLDMKALTNHYDKKEIPAKALLAGCNILLYCNEEESPYIAIEEIVKGVENNEIPLALIEENYKKIISLKADRIKQFGPLAKEKRDKIIGCDEHRHLADCIREGRLPDNIKN